MSSSPKNSIKQPIRRLEIQINNFNVAIPHHVDLLKRHKVNILKYQAQHDWVKLNKEQINVSRLVKQLKELLYQMETLRSQVLDCDIEQFDKRVSNARKSLMSAIEEYIELQLNLPLSRPQSPKSEDHEEEHPLNDRYVLLQEEQQDLQNEQACLHTWNNLQEDISQFHELFVDINKIVDDQRVLVNKAESDIEETEVNVTEGERLLAKAARYKVAMYPLAGVIIGTCLGGPIGLVAGLKVGGLAAISGGLLGFTGATILKKKQLQMQKSQSTTDQTMTEQLNLAERPSSSLENLRETKKDL
ncbi:syntaxin 17 [Halictus rubicundus]|uniref:syntaxin 17 n=1 Tax=Halictus rubicundus TaxID=77578 RepID=UPI004035FF7B